jgi:hypothetical protein
MARQYVSPADKFVRQILKAAIKGSPAQALTRSTIEAWFEKATADDIAAAIAHGIREGWLTSQADAWLVTAAGKDIGRRSRAGVKNKLRRL